MNDIFNEIVVTNWLWYFILGVVTTTIAITQDYAPALKIRPATELILTVIFGVFIFLTWPFWLGRIIGLVFDKYLRS